MPQDTFLKLEYPTGDGSLGDSTNPAHPKEIAVTSFGWTVTNSSYVQSGPNYGTGKPSFQNLLVSKYVDTASNDLLKLVATGQHMPRAWLFVRRPAGATPAFDYFTYEMRDVIVTSLTVRGNEGDIAVTEDLQLNFAWVGLSYVPQGSKGEPLPAQTFRWDIVRNTQA